MELNERLAKAFEIAGKSRRQLQQEMGISHSTLSQWLSGHIKALKADSATRIEQATGVRAEWIVKGTGPQLVVDSSQAVLPSLGVRQVPLLNNAEALGWSSASRPYDVKPEGWLYEDLSMPECAFALRVPDDAMAPLLQLGDLLVLDPTATPAPGSVVAAATERAVVLRQYRQHSLGVFPATFELTPLNGLHASVSSDQGDVRVIGVAVGYRRRLR